MSIHLAIFGKPRYLGLLDITEPFPARGAPLVVETMRGTEMALLGGALSSEQEARYRASCNEDASDSQVKGGEPILQEIAFARMATCEDIDAASSAREEEEYVLVKARALLSNHNLPMKLVDVEYLLDRKKLFFYFTSEQRVDFGLREGPRQGVQDADRIEADRRAGRGQDRQGHSPVRP